MQIKTLELATLQPHPLNSNRMSKAMLDKLAAHIGRSGNYPPLIVRPIEGGRYQIIDGHHRAKALQKLDYRDAQCLCWPVDDAQALLLLATLNRLAGSDDPHDRAALVEKLSQHYSADQLPALLPEQDDQLRQLLGLNQPPPPRPQTQGFQAKLPRAVYFFLTPPDAKKLEQALRQLDGSREQALMALVDRGSEGCRVRCADL